VRTSFAPRPRRQFRPCVKAPGSPFVARSQPLSRTCCARLDHPSQPSALQLRHRPGVRSGARRVLDDGSSTMFAKSATHANARRSGRRRISRLHVEALEDRCLLDGGLFRSIDGTGNNLFHPEWGSTNERLLRMAPAAYDDGKATPAEANRPGARALSNLLAA